jgi:hypothetical protein
MKTFSVFFYITLTCFSFACPADTFHCKDITGKFIFTDDKFKCADHKAAPTQTNSHTAQESYNFSDEIPDLMQTDPRANFIDKGTYFCGPVAASNSLAWLENNNDVNYQIALVKKLSTANYMNTLANKGTKVVDFVQGIDRYATETWGSYKRLEFSGWARVPKKNRSELDTPTVAWLLSGLHANSSVLLIIGWYKTENTHYQRTGGHWVTLTGYKQGKIVIHDPSARSGKELHNEFISLSILNGGTLRDEEGIERPAKNHFVFEKGMPISNGADIAIMEGAVIFER